MKNDAATATLITEGLAKTYRPRRGQAVEALKPLDLSIEQGEIFGLLGPNGAGKTTLVKLLLGIINPTQGRALVLGQPSSSVQAKRLIGYLPENHRFPQYLSGRQLLTIFGQLAGISGAELRRRIDELLGLVGLSDWHDVKVRKYSKGMLQRIGLAQALINRPRLLFLDEPTDGIDPIGRKQIRDILLRVREEGTTIFVNSHLLSEVELITDRVAILNHGVVVKMGRTSELTESPDEFEIGVSELNGMANDDIPGLLSRSEDGRTLAVKAGSTAELNAAIDVLRSQGILIESINTKRNTLEQLFFELIESA